MKFTFMLVDPDTERVKRTACRARPEPVNVNQRKVFT